MSDDFRNGTQFEFTDVSSEQWREYSFPDAAAPNGLHVVRIEGPQRLHVSASGGHRIYDAGGISNYVPAGWVHLRWKVKEGTPHFVA